MYDQSYPQNPVQNPAAGYAPVPAGPPEPKRSHKGAFVAISAVIALILVAGGLALFGPFRAVSTTQAAANGLPSSRNAASSTAAGEIPTSIEVPAADEAPTTVAPVVPTGGQAPAGNSSGSNGGGSSSGGGAPAPQAPPAPPAPSAPAPVITSFLTPENIDCHNGNSQTFTASWSTTNAVKVTISIDGPGVYKTYGPTGSDSLPFDCSTPHTFLLTAYGQSGSTVTSSITLQPRNVQVPSSDDEDADSQSVPDPTHGDS
jgi:hypothetical protein